MTSHDRPEFARAMLALGETFNEPISDIRSAAYFDALQDLTIEQVTIAAHLAIRSCRFFPKPIELRELIAGTPDANADAAWGEVLREVRRVGYIGTPRFADERTARAIQETFGSWVHLCETLPAEGPELIGWMKQFKACWQSQDTRQIDQRLNPGTVAPNVLTFIQAEQKRLAGGRR